MKFIYKVYVFLGLLVLANNAVFGMEEGAQPAKKQKVEETAPVKVPSLQKLSLNTIKKYFQDLPAEDFFSQFNDILKDLAPGYQDLLIQNLEQLLIKKLINIHFLSYKQNQFIQLLKLAENLKNTLLDTVITKLTLEYPFMFGPSVDLQLPDQRILFYLPDTRYEKKFGLNGPHITTYTLELDKFSLNNFFYIPNHKLLLCYLTGIQYSNSAPHEKRGYQQLFVRHMPSKTIIFQDGDFDKLPIYPFITGYNPKNDFFILQLERGILPYKIIMNNDIPRISRDPIDYLQVNASIKRAVFVTNGIVILQENAPKSYILRLVDNTLRPNIGKTKAKFSFPNNAIDANVIAHPEKNYIVTYSIIPHPQEKTVEFNIKKLEVLKTKFKLIKEFTYTSDLKNTPRDLSKEKISKDLDQYLSSSFPDDNPLTWNQKNRNVKIIRSIIKPITLFQDAIKTVQEDHTQQTTFFDALANLLQQKITLTKPMPVKIMPEQQAPPTGPEGKMEEKES